LGILGGALIYLRTHLATFCSRVLAPIPFYCHCALLRRPAGRPEQPLLELAWPVGARPLLRLPNPPPAARPAGPCTCCLPLAARPVDKKQHNVKIDLGKGMAIDIYRDLFECIYLLTCVRPFCTWQASITKPRHVQEEILRPKP